MKNLVGGVVEVGRGEQGYLCFDHVGGGTAIYDGTETFRCVVTKQFHDYECGWRMVGELVGPKALADAHRLGFVPEKIYFGERCDIALIGDDTENGVVGGKHTALGHRAR
jgi:hypothetical protein